jgi:hypothetical protein
MTALARRTAIGSALLVGAFLVILFGFLNHNGGARPCHGCGLLPEGSVAAVSIPKGTSGSEIASRSLVSAKLVRSSKGLLVSLYQVRNDVVIRTIRAGALLRVADFALPGPIYYPRGYPKNVPATEIPDRIRMSRELGPPRSGGYVEVARGVWVDGSISDAALDEHVANGHLIGDCRSVRAFQAHNPKISFRTKCWRKLTPIS